MRHNMLYSWATHPRWQAGW